MAKIGASFRLLAEVAASAAFGPVGTRGVDAFIDVYNQLAEVQVQRGRMLTLEEAQVEVMRLLDNPPLPPRQAAGLDPVEGHENGPGVAGDDET